LNGSATGRGGGAVGGAAIAREPSVIGGGSGDGVRRATIRKPKALQNMSKCAAMRSQSAEKRHNNPKQDSHLPTKCRLAGGDQERGHKDEQRPLLHRKCKLRRCLKCVGRVRAR
jgi:hypothetical protein